MNGTDIFGLFTGTLGVLGSLWSLAQWLSPYTRLYALQRSLQHLDRLFDEVVDGGVRLDANVMQGMWQHYSRIHHDYIHLRARTLSAPSFLHTFNLVVTGVPQKITRLDNEARALRDDMHYERDIARLRSNLLTDGTNVQVLSEV